jgi:hypothetical protein
MEEVTNPRLMLMRIHNFVKQFNDYRPTADSKNTIIGYYNTFYHGNEGVCMVYIPTGPKIPTVIIGYEARANGDVFVVTNLIKRYSLMKCQEPSLKNVYQKIMSLKEKTKEEQ